VPLDTPSTLPRAAIASSGDCGLTLASAAARPLGRPEARVDTSASSLEHAGQLGIPMGLKVSHAPQTIPISSAALTARAQRPRGRSRGRRDASSDAEVVAPQRVLDVSAETGQAERVSSPGAFRVLRSLALPAVLALIACAESNSPEAVADAFAEAYFRRMDQQKAKEFTALGASAMLDAELREVSEIRKEGYDPAEAGAAVTLKRGPSSHRDQRIRIPYEVVVSHDDVKTTRDADIELTQLEGSWKVVRVGLTARP
jgi:hypothetical protein